MAYKSGDITLGGLRPDRHLGEAPYVILSLFLASGPTQAESVLSRPFGCRCDLTHDLTHVII